METGKLTAENTKLSPQRTATIALYGDKPFRLPRLK